MNTKGPKLQIFEYIEIIQYVFVFSVACLKNACHWEGWFAGCGEVDGQCYFLNDLLKNVIIVNLFETEAVYQLFYIGFCIVFILMVGNKSISPF